MIRTKFCGALKARFRSKTLTLEVQYSMYPSLDLQGYKSEKGALLSTSFTHRF